MEKHQETLKTLFRICTKRLGRVSYDVLTPVEKKGNIPMIEHCFGVTPMTNASPTRSIDLYNNITVHRISTLVHRFCNSCYLTMTRMKNAVKNGTVYRTSLIPYVWLEHAETNCTTCELLKTRRGGGRPKTRQNIQGCPKQLSDHIKSVASQR